MIEFSRPALPGHLYPLSPGVAREALEIARDPDLDVVFESMWGNRAPSLPRECRLFGSSVAVIGAIHNRGIGQEHRRILVVLQVPESYGPALRAVQASLVGSFLLDWRTRTPEDQWRVWAMFLMADRDGGLACVPVRRPSRPGATMPPNKM